MKSTVLFCSLLLLCLSATIETKAQPDLSPKTVQAVIGKIISIAADPASDGSELLDTIYGGSAFGSYRFLSTVQYPAAKPAIVYRNENLWVGNTATIKYTWNCVLMTSGTKSGSNFINEELKLLNSINEIIPGVLPDSVTHTWKLKNGIEINISRGLNRNYADDDLNISVSVNKKLIANKDQNITKILERYNALIDYIPSGNLLQAHGKVAFFKLFIETGDAKQTAELTAPLLKKIADKDIRQAFNMLMELPGKAPVPTLMATFTKDQRKAINDYATGVITTFNNKQNGVTTPAYTVGSGSVFIYNVQQLYKDPNTNEYMYLQSADWANNKFVINYCSWYTAANGNRSLRHHENDVIVGKDFFDKKSWTRVSVGSCHTCGGHGKVLSSTPYSYSITEKGIYNKYEISGSGYKTKSITCGSCGGSGILEYYLK